MSLGLDSVNFDFILEICFYIQWMDEERLVLLDVQFGENG